MSSCSGSGNRLGVVIGGSDQERDHGTFGHGQPPEFHVPECHAHVQLDGRVVAQEFLHRRRDQFEPLPQQGELIGVAQERPVCRELSVGTSRSPASRMYRWATQTARAIAFRGTIP